MTALLDSLVPYMVGNATMLAPDSTDDHLATIYRHGSWYEIDLLTAIKDIKQGGVFVDIGAGYGNHTVYFAVECKADHVVAVEPYPGNFAVLEANVRQNGLGDIVEPANALIHPEWTSATLNPPEGMDALPDAWSWSSQPMLTEGGDTPCFTLDALLEGLEVDVIKIDVEEMGPAVLGSGLEMLARCRPLVAIEAEPSEQKETDGLLLSLGYECLGRYCATPTFLWRAP